MNHVAAVSNIGALVLIDVKNDRCGAGTSVLGDPVVAPELMATLA